MYMYIYVYIYTYMYTYRCVSTYIYIYMYMLAVRSTMSSTTIRCSYTPESPANQFPGESLEGKTEELKFAGHP